MEWKQITGLVVGVVIAALLLTTLVIPVIGETTTTEHTFTNDGYFRMAHYGTDTDITLTWDVENPKTVVVNDEEIPINYNVTGGSVTIVADTNFIARLTTLENSIYLSFIGSGGGTHTATTSATYAFSGGNLTVTNNSSGATSTYTATYDYLYVPSLDGSYVMKKYDQESYLNGDSVIFASGVTKVKYSGGTTTSPGMGFEFTGTIDDGVDGRVWRGADDVTVSNEQINYAAVSSYVNLYTFDSITATATYHETVDDEEVTTDTELTYNYLLVPYQVTAEKAQHLDGSSIAIMSIIPLLLTVGIIMAVVGVFVLRRE